MKLFKKKETKDDVLFEDLIQVNKEITGVLRFYVAFSEDNYDKLYNAAALLGEIVEFVREKMQVEARYVSCSFDSVKPSVRESGAIYATYRRDDEYDERFRRKLQKYFDKNVEEQ